MDEQAKREVRLAKKREYYINNKDQISLQKQDYYKRNCEKIISYSLDYYRQNRETRIEKSQAYNETNKDRLALAAKIRYQEDPERFREKARLEYHADPEKANKRNKEWIRKNPELRQASRRKSNARQRESNPSFRINGALRSRMRKALAGNSKSTSTIELLGCTVPELREHLEEQFLPGMSWENYTLAGWHIDHIRPCASFDLTDPEQQRQCFHFTNLQPLWAKDNLVKGDKWDPETEAETEAA
jgi:hypothetical protein